MKKKFLHSFLPKRYCVSIPSGSNVPLLTSFSLQRSGQHLILDWMCRGWCNDILHMNNCRFYSTGMKRRLTPKTGRRVIYTSKGIDDSKVQWRHHLQESLPKLLPPTVLFSMEDINPLQKDYCSLLRASSPCVVVILRDPPNWLASGLRHGLHSPSGLQKNIQILKAYLNIALARNSYGFNCVDINYNAFTLDDGYRRSLANTFPLFNQTKAEVAIKNTPVFGGGSSFTEGEGEMSDVHNRWKHYQDDPLYRSMLKDPELLELSLSYFGPSPALQFMQDLSS